MLPDPRWSFTTSTKKPPKFQSTKSLAIARHVVSTHRVACRFDLYVVQHGVTTQRFAWHRSESSWSSMTVNYFT